MALNKASLKADLKRILSNPTTQGNVDQVSEDLATAIDAYIKSATAVGVDSGGYTHNLTLS